MPDHKTNKCKRKCIYRSEMPRVNSCDYCYITGKMRGCPAGESCTRFVAGKRCRGRVSLPPMKYREDEHEIIAYLHERNQRLF